VSGNTVNRPVSGVSMAALDGYPTLTFHRDGSVSSDAEVYLTTAAHGPSWFRAITVDEATGRVTLYRLNAQASAWVRASQ
jgi:hypothetical protein